MSHVWKSGCLIDWVKISSILFNKCIFHGRNKINLVLLRVKFKFLPCLFDFCFVALNLVDIEKFRLEFC